MKQILIILVLVGMFLNAKTAVPYVGVSVEKTIAIEAIIDIDEDVIGVRLRDNITGNGCFVTYNQTTGEVFPKKSKYECDQSNGIIFVTDNATTSYGMLTVTLVSYLKGFWNDYKWYYEDPKKDKIVTSAYQPDNIVYTTAEKAKAFKKIQVLVCGAPPRFNNDIHLSVKFALMVFKMYEELNSTDMTNFLYGKTKAQYCNMKQKDDL